MYIKNNNTADIIKSEKYLGVQVLRGLAATLVVIYHSIVMYNEKIHSLNSRNMWINGQAGVDIFFVISGFVMYITIISKPQKYGFIDAFVFLKRRLIRIAPLYWFFTTLKILFLKLIPSITLHVKYTLSCILASYLFLQYKNQLGDFQPVLIVGWTLNYEIFFYFLIFIALLFRFQLVSFLSMVLLIISVVGILVELHFPNYRIPFAPIILEFLLGIIIGKTIYLVRGKTLISGSIFLLGFILILFVSPGFRILNWGIPASLIVLGTVGCERLFIEYKEKLKILEHIGNASYSTYLSHGFILPIIAAIILKTGYTSKTPLFLVVLICIFSCLIVGSIIYKYIEKPLIKIFIK
jgi:peptidoglycan/LPS O-acetylase OafA/YrhL